MKRVVWLILVLLLLDLTEDGGLGKVMFVPPQSAAETSLTPSECDFGEVDPRYSLTLPDCRDMSGPNQFQPVTVRVNPALKIITHCNTGSSGGIPRERAFLP